MGHKREYVAALSLFFALALAAILLLRGNSSIVNAAAALTAFGVVVAAIFHKGGGRRATILLALIAAVGWLIEVLGVHTSVPFGAYSYGGNISWSAFGVPAAAGLHWALVVYLAYCATAMLEMNNRRMATVAGIVVVFDLVMEPAVAALGYRSFAMEDNPFQHYAASFFIAYLMAQLIRRVAPSIENRMALPLVAIYLIFYGVLDLILLKLIS